MRNLSLMVTLLVVGVCFPAQLRADSTTLNFEGFADSTILTSQYGGVTFSNAIILTAGISLNEFEFPPHSGSNVASDDGGPMSIVFATPITSFSGDFTYSELLTLDAFNSSNMLVASSTSLFTNNMALSGAAGSNPNELISLVFDAGISKVTISGDPFGGSFTLDDVTYTSGSGPVTTPEPSSVWLVLLGLGLCLGLRRAA